MTGERCAQCGATGRIPERRCANRHHVCSKCWNENGAERKFVLSSLAYDTTNTTTTAGVTP